MDELKVHDVLPDGYYYPVYADLKKLKTNIFAAIPTFNSILDHTSKYTLICRGTSGICIAQALAVELANLGYQLEIKYIKKDTEINHGHGYSFSEHYKTLIVVDDFMCSGETMKQIAKAIPTGLVEIVFACGENYHLPILKSLFPKAKHWIC